jgi:hypothetical protein
MMRDVDSGATFGDEMYPGKSLTMTALPEGTFVTFNGRNYDFPILSLALAGCDNGILKAASDDIIIGGMKPWDIERKYGGLDMRKVDHIDLIEVAPGQCGLKLYAGRMHSERLQDLPIDPSESISPEMRAQLIDYCGNGDLPATTDLYLKLKPQIDLRSEMSKEFGVDLRSKSDAQIAEAVIKKECERDLGVRIYRPKIHPDYKFKYQVPDFIDFNSPGMKNVLRVVREAEFSMDTNGSVEMPRELAGLRIRIGQGVYRMGIGGLHSSESCVSYYANDEYEIIDRDVASYYPSIILRQQLAPSHLGATFLSVYEGLVRRRLDAKKRKDSVTNEALKVVINGSFGKFGSKWSTLYSPDLMIQVTVTGQLALLMLIELLEDQGIRVISANTDGIVIYCHKSKKDMLNAIIQMWEYLSGYETEDTHYRSIHSRDVNNYVAVKTDGEVKQKGAYSFVGSKKSELEKNPTAYVCIDAVLAYLTENRPIDVTIGHCRDVTRFICVRTVKGGANYGTQYLGKSVRWYYAKNETRTINYASNDNKVPLTDGARPMMQLTKEVPYDLDYQWYVDSAKDILREIGL